MEFLKVGLAVWKIIIPKNPRNCKLPPPLPGAATAWFKGACGPGTQGVDGIRTLLWKWDVYLWFDFFSRSFIVILFSSGTEFPIPNSLLLSIDSHDLCLMFCSLFFVHIMRSLEKRHCSCIRTALLEYSSLWFSPFVIYYVTCRVPSVTRFAFFDGVHISIYFHECKFIFCICQLFHVRWKQK